MNSLLCFVVLAVSAVSAYNIGGKNCNAMDVLCDKEAAKTCADIEKKERNYDVNLTNITLGNIPTANDVWPLTFFPCYLCKAGYVMNKEVQYEKLHKSLGLGSTADITVCKCFNDFYADRKVMEIVDCFFKATIETC